MNKSFLLSTTIFSLLLIFLSLVGWKIDGSLFFVATLLLGLIKFFGTIIYIITGKVSFRSYRRMILLLFLGAIIGFIIFDLPSIYLFNIWKYQADIPNPFSNFILYAIQTLGWGAFLLVFYDSYKLIHLSLDKNTHMIGFSNHKGVDKKIFSIIGFLGLLFIITSVVLVVFGPRSNWWSATLGAFGVWFILENIEFRTTGKTLIFSLIKGHLTPLVSIF